MGLDKTRESGRGRQPAVESLEGRTVLTTYRAASVAQLVADVATAESAGGNNTIRLVQGTYNLSAPIQIRNPGNLTIEGSTTLPSSVRIVGGPSNRVFDVVGGNTTFSGISIVGGSGVDVGGGISARNANVTVSKSVVSQNTAIQAGGGIYVNGGTLHVDRSSVNGNSASGHSLDVGGGIAAVDAQVTLTYATINSNSVTNADVNPLGVLIDNGGGIFALGSKLTIGNTTIARNRAFPATSGPRASASGGGIATSGSLVNINASLIQGNILDTITSAVTTANGSAFSMVDSNATIRNTTITGNTPGHKLTFNAPGSSVVFQGSTLAGKKIAGTYTLPRTGK